MRECGTVSCHYEKGDANTLLNLLVKRNLKDLLTTWAIVDMSVSTQLESVTSL